MKLRGRAVLFVLLLAGVVMSVSAGTLSAQTEPIQQSERALLAGYAKAVAYSGFRSGQHPDRGGGAANPTDEEIVADLTLLIRDTDLRLIRLYDSQENSAAVLRIIREQALPLKVMLGIWLEAEISNHFGCPWLYEPIAGDVLQANKEKNSAEIVRGIGLANEYPDIVVAVNVGNEVLVSWTDHLVSMKNLMKYVRRVKRSIPQPVTVAENYSCWAQQGAELAKVVDFITVHTYPLWEGKNIDEALPYTVRNIQIIRNNFPQRRIVIGEAGWASEASEFGAQASEENQLRYYRELTDWAAQMNITTFWFEAFDEDWKGDPSDPEGAEKHWGLFTVDRTPKQGAAALLHPADDRSAAGTNR